MRAFVFTDDSSNKFWNIELNGMTYTVTFGRVGTKGQAQTKLFDTAEAARKAHDKLIAEKVKKGYVETSPAPAVPPKPVSTEQKALEAALLSHPDELAAHSAYADYLTEHDDPRGAFVQTQLALEDPARSKTERDALRTREAALWNEYKGEWLGELARFDGEWCGDDKPFLFRFARGWLDTVRTLPTFEAIAEALARATQVRLLRRLEIIYDMRYHPFEFDQFTEKVNATLPEEEQLDEDDMYMSDPTILLPALAKSPYLTNLRVFKYGFSDDHPRGPSHSTMVQPFESDSEELLNLLKACPRLEELYLNTDMNAVENVFGSELLGSLRVFQYYYGVGRYNDPADPYPLSALAQNASLKRLHTLRFHPGRDAGIALGEFAALLNSPNLPALKHLQVHMANFGDDGADAVVASGILKRLKTLDLGYGNLTDAGAYALAACPDLKNLTSLDVSQNALSSLGVDALRQTGVAVVADEQHMPDGDDARDYRYSVDWE